MHPVAHYFLALCELRKSLEGILVGDLILNYLRAQQEQAIALLKPVAPPANGRAPKSSIINYLSVARTVRPGIDAHY